MSLLEITNLSIDYRTEAGAVRAVEDVTFDMPEGEILGLVGESGSGKTTVARALNGMLPANGEVVQGSIQFGDQDVTTLTQRELQRLRWREIAIIPQNAMNALDPVYKIGSQFREVIQTHTDLTKSDADERTRSLLQRVGLEANIFRDYPHELSGGQRQRVVIALALVLDPSIIIADEPTTGLDVVVQDAILELILDIQQETNNSVLFITHDISAITEVADTVAVMYGGKIMEQGPMVEVFASPSHPYTMGLINSFPDISQISEELVTIPGSPPDPHDLPTGCRFVDRCPFATDTCFDTPPEDEVSTDHTARCHYIEHAAEFRNRSRERSTWEVQE